jgi:penicillin-binding protein 1B
VLDANGQPLARYDLSVERVIDPAPAFLINRALQMVVAEGTARALNQRFSPELGLAGKTGTTNDLRDSWFAGYDGEKLGVIWVGRDDNQPMGLSGATGALRIWSDLYAEAGVVPQQVLQPETVSWHGVDRQSDGLADRGCNDTVQLPFIESAVLPARAPCASGSAPDWLPDWLR